MNIAFRIRRVLVVLVLLSTAMCLAVAKSRDCSQQSPVWFGSWRENGNEEGVVGVYVSLLLHSSCPSTTSSVDMTIAFSVARIGNRATHHCPDTLIDINDDGLVSFPGLYDPMDCVTNALLFHKTFFNEHIKLELQLDETSSSAVRKLTMGNKQIIITSFSDLSNTIPIPQHPQGVRFCSADEKWQVTVFNKTTNTALTVHSPKFSSFSGDIRCDGSNVQKPYPSPFLDVGLGLRANDPCNSCVSRALSASFGGVGGGNVCGVLALLNDELVITPRRLDGMADELPPLDLKRSLCKVPAKSDTAARVHQLSGHKYCGTYAGTPYVELSFSTPSKQKVKQEAGDDGDGIVAMKATATTTGYTRSCDEVLMKIDFSHQFRNMDVADPASVGAKCMHELMASVGRTPWYSLRHHEDSDLLWMTIQLGAFPLTRC